LHGRRTWRQHSLFFVSSCVRLVNLLFPTPQMCSFVKVIDIKLPTTPYRPTAASKTILSRNRRLLLMCLWSVIFHII